VCVADRFLGGRLSDIGTVLVNALELDGGLSQNQDDECSRPGVDLDASLLAT
jgi:hypothetical protein